MRNNRILPPVMIATGLTALALTASVPGGASEKDEFYGLPNGKGREEVGIYCAPCHSLALVVQQGLTREQWKELFVWMVEEQDMEPIPEEDRKLVLDYLDKHVGPGTHKQRLRARGIVR